MCKRTSEAKQVEQTVKPQETLTEEHSPSTGKKQIIKEKGCEANTKLNSSQKAIYTFLGICLFLFVVMLVWLSIIYSNCFNVDYKLISSLSDEAVKDSLIVNLTSQQSITLTITGVVATFLGLLLSGLTIIRELKLDKNTNEVEMLKIETGRLIRELKSTYDLLIIKNSFSNLEIGAYCNTKRTMLLRLQGQLVNAECDNELFDHQLLDELYSYTSYKFGYPTRDEAKEAYRKVDSIGKRLLDKIGTNLDYSSCCKRYITHLKCAEAGYNLLTNCADNVDSTLDKKTIYHSVVQHYNDALLEDDFNADLDGFVQCRLGLLENWNEKYKWDEAGVPSDTLKKAKSKLLLAIKKNNCEKWYYSLAATCMRLSSHEKINSIKEELLNEAEGYCKKSLLINAEAINAYVNLANIQVYKINNLLEVSKEIFKKASFSIDESKREKYNKYCEEGLKYCNDALRKKENSIGALRKKASFLCFKTKLNLSVEETEELFKEAIETIKKAEEVEEVCTHDKIPSNTIVDEKEALNHFITNSKLKEETKTKLISRLAKT